MTWASLRLEPTLVLRAGATSAAATAAVAPLRAVTVAAETTRGDGALAATASGRIVRGGEGLVRSGVREDDEPLQPSAPIPFDPTPAPSRIPPAGDDRRATAQGKAAESGLPDLSGESWGMAPIRWMGNTGTSGNMFSDGNGGRTFSINNDLSVQASSFIVAPYIAQWTSTFGMNSSDTWQSVATGPKIKSSGDTYSIGGAINLFPVSLFPFSASLGHSTTESKSNGEKYPGSSTHIGLRQDYRTADGRDRYSASYNRNSLSIGRESGHSSSMQGSYSTRRVFEPEHLLEGEHSFNINLFGNFPDSNGRYGLQSTLLSANASHNWKVHEDLSINNSVTLSGTRGDQLQGAVSVSNDSTIFLASSNFNWLPFEDLPLTVTGGAFLTQTETSLQVPASTGAGVASSQNSQQSLGGFVSGNYRFNNNFSVSGSGSLTTTSSNSDGNRLAATSSTGNSLTSAASNGNRFTTASAGANAFYAGDPLTFGSYIYSWGAGGSLNSFFSNTGDSSVNPSASVNHSLVRTIVIDDRQSINLNAGQSLGFAQSQGSTSYSLSNTAGASWRAQYGEALTANLGGTGGYTISSGQSGNNDYLTVSLLGAVMYQLSSRAALSFNANLVWSQNNTGTAQSQDLSQLSIIDRQTQLTGSVSLNYTHSSPFSIRNLNYSANLLWVSSQSNQFTLTGGNALASQSQQSISFQNMLDYRIGRLSFRLNGAMISQNGQQSAVLFGSVNRVFDGFFDGRW